MNLSREWREKREEAIKARDAASKGKRQEIIAKAEGSIDAFYEEYARKKERNIRENKWVFGIASTDICLRSLQGTRETVPREPITFPFVWNHLVANLRPRRTAELTKQNHFPGRT